MPSCRVAESSARQRGESAIRRATQARATNRPTRNAAIAPSTLPAETSTTPSTTPNANPAPSVSIVPGTASTAATVYAATNSAPAPRG